MTSLEDLWRVAPENEGFDPVMYPEMKPYLARVPDDGDLGLRRLLEWPEALATRDRRRRRVRRSTSRKRAREASS